MSYLVGIDVGTTNVKALAFDLDGRVAARASEPTPTIPEGRGCAVHDADALWQTICRLLRQMIKEVTPETIAGLAIASMGEEGFPLDGRGDVLYPGILWHDERTRDLTTWWEEELKPERVYRLTGLPIGHTFTALKLQWLYRHEPDVMRRAAHWLWVSDYFAYRLTGAMVTTPSLASRTLLYDLAAGRWSEELLTASAIPASLLPPIVPSGTPVGDVSREASVATGLRAGTPVIAGGHDHICGCLAAGAVAPGDIIHSGGTAEAFVRILTRAELEDLLAHPGELACGAHVLPNRYYAERGRYSGAIIAWWERLLQGRGSLDELRARAQAAPAGANGLVFLPYMYGKGPPGADGAATGSLLGVTGDHDPAEILRAVVEGVSYDAIELQRLLRPQEGGGVTVIGGLVSNRLWLELKAAVLDVVVRVPEEREAVAQGASFLAGLGVGAYGDPQAILARTLRFAETVQPEAETVVQYRDLYTSRYLPAAAGAARLIRRKGASAG
jgi:xylulokinase